MNKSDLKELEGAQNRGWELNVLEFDGLGEESDYKELPSSLCSISVTALGDFMIWSHTDLDPSP